MTRGAPEWQRIGSRVLGTLGKEPFKYCYPPVQMGVLPVVHSRPALCLLPSALGTHLSLVRLFLSKRLLPTLVLGPWVFFIICLSVSMSLSLSLSPLVLREADFFNLLAGSPASCPAQACMSPSQFLPHLRVCGSSKQIPLGCQPHVFLSCLWGMGLPRQQKPSALSFLC